MFPFLRRVFSESRGSRPATGCPSSYRPQLESREERALPSASRVWDGAGNLFLFVNYSDSSLYRYDANGVSYWGSKVRSVHAFRDPQGNLGVDVIYGDRSSPYGGDWIEYDVTGAHAKGSGYFFAATSFDNPGRKTLDAQIANGDTSGSVYSFYEFDYTNTPRSIGTAFPDIAFYALTTFDPAGDQRTDALFYGFQSPDGAHFQN